MRLLRISLGRVLSTLEKISGVEYADDLISENIGGSADIHYLQRGVVYLLNLKSLVEHDKTVRRIAYDRSRKSSPRWSLR